MANIGSAFGWMGLILALSSFRTPLQTTTEIKMLTAETREETRADVDELAPPTPASAQLPTPREIPQQNGMMQVRMLGHGRPIALVGGGLTGWKSWEPHAERLASNRTVALIQPLNVQLGLENRPLPEGYGVRTESAALKKALDHIGWRGPVDVVAWSYGALVSLDFALDHPERIRTLTLIEPPASWVLPDTEAADPSLTLFETLDLDGEITEADLESILPPMGLVPPGMSPRDLPQWPVWAEHRRSLRVLRAPTVHADDPGRLQALNVPVLLVSGTATELYYERIQESLARSLPNASRLVLPEAHAPHIVSMDRFLAELDHFHETPEAPDVRYVRSPDATSIGYLQQGSGEPIIFVHGTSADHRSWLLVASHLEDAFSIRAIDRRGRGFSGDHPAHDLQREAEDLAAVAAAIGRPVTVFGHSFGGLIALEAALQSDAIGSLILYEPILPTGEATGDTGAVSRLEGLVADGKLEEAMEDFLRHVALIPEHELQSYRKSPLWDARVPIAATIPRELRIERSYAFDPVRFAGMHTPTLLLLGSESPREYRDAVATLEQELPDAEVAILSGQQHMAHHRDPVQVAEAVRRFLTTRAPTSTGSAD